MTIKIHFEGKLTAGYYNDMEAGHPVFIDGNSLSDAVKDKLDEMGYDSDFCYGPCSTEETVKNPLVGKKIKIIIEIFE